MGPKALEDEDAVFKYQWQVLNGATWANIAGASPLMSVNIARLVGCMAGSFVASSDGRGGTSVTEPPANQQQFLTQSHA